MKMILPRYLPPHRWFLPHCHNRINQQKIERKSNRNSDEDIREFTCIYDFYQYRSFPESNFNHSGSFATRTFFQTYWSAGEIFFTADSEKFSKRSFKIFQLSSSSFTVSISLAASFLFVIFNSIFFYRGEDRNYRVCSLVGSRNFLHRVRCTNESVWLLRKKYVFSIRSDTRVATISAQT